MSVVIKVENLSKSYILHHEQREKYETLRDIAAQKAKNIFASTNGKQKVPSTELFWALKDVSFEVQQGDRIGIIGRNGAGKSTLLKILSRITDPTKGKVSIKGRVASLLEVGTGFHPELTGRENIFLNGSILGLSRVEIKNKFDEIVDFAEVEKFLDTPVKRYSSGMYVRLAFAVAAHLEPEILIVDEVLAVGDAQFQKKCLGKMEDVSKNEGRTILFVSHNMEAVQRLCSNGILLKQGEIKSAGNINTIVHDYINLTESNKSVFEIKRPLDYDKIKGYVTQIQIEDVDGKLMNEIPIGKTWKCRIHFNLNQDIEHFIIGFGIVTPLGAALRTSWSIPQAIKAGNYQAVFFNDDIHLTSGTFGIVVGISENKNTFHYVDQVAHVSISDISNLTGDKRIVNSMSGLLINQMKSEIHPV